MAAPYAPFPVNWGTMPKRLRIHHLFTELIGSTVFLLATWFTKTLKVERFYPAFAASKSGRRSAARTPGHQGSVTMDRPHSRRAARLSRPFVLPGSRCNLPQHATRTTSTDGPFTIRQKVQAQTPPRSSVAVRTSVETKGTTKGDDQRRRPKVVGSRVMPVTGPGRGD